MNIEAGQQGLAMTSSSRRLTPFPAWQQPGTQTSAGRDSALLGQPQELYAEVERLHLEKSQIAGSAYHLSNRDNEAIFKSLTESLSLVTWTGKANQSLTCSRFIFYTGQGLVSIVVRPAAGVSQPQQQQPLSTLTERKANLAESFREEFKKAPEKSMEWLRRVARDHRYAGREMASVLLPYLVKASYAQQNLISSALDELVNAEDILDAALERYDQTGDRRLLRIADGLLYERGIIAWPALEKFARSRRAECRYFVGTIAGLGDVGEDRRRQTLADLAHNPDVETRREVLEVLESGALSDPLPVWEILAHDTDDDIQELASDRLASRKN